MSCCPTAGRHCARPSQPLVREVFQRREAYFAAKADTLFELELYLVVLSERWANTRQRGRALGITRTMAAGVRAALSATEATARTAIFMLEEATKGHHDARP